MDINELMRALSAKKKKRNVFLSFDYEPDVFRVSQVRNMGIVEDKPLLSANEWEEIKKGKDEAIKKWIDDNMKYKSCVIVLVGTWTAYKRWVQYEIEKAWNDKKGLVGIHIHNLQCPKNRYSNKGVCPFDQFTIDSLGFCYKTTNPFIFSLLRKVKYLSGIIKCYDPPTFPIERLYDPTITTGQAVYKYIQDNIESWVEEAIRIRNQYILNFP